MTKKILYILLLLIIPFFLIFCLRGLIVNFPSGDNLLIEKNLDKEVWRAFSAFLAIGAAFSSFIILKKDSILNLAIFSITTNMISSIIYFFFSMYIYDQTKVVNAEYLKLDAIAMLIFFAICCCFSLFFVLLYKSYNNYIKSKKNTKK